jgi:hypothetical protein
MVKYQRSKSVSFFTARFQRVCYTLFPGFLSKVFWH